MAFVVNESAEMHHANHVDGLANVFAKEQYLNERDGDESNAMGFRNGVVWNCHCRADVLAFRAEGAKL